MKHLLLGLALLTGAGAGVESTDTYPKNPNIDTLHYAFRLTLSDATDEIVGEATADIRFLADGITRVRLDLINQGSAGRGMTVSDVTSSDGPVTFTHQNDELFSTPPAPTQANQRSQYTVRYRGIPATGLIIGAQQARGPDILHRQLAQQDPGPTAVLLRGEPPLQNRGHATARAWTSLNQ